MIVDLDSDDSTNPLVATQPRFLLTGRIDRDMLFRSIEEVVARNKILYSKAAEIDGVTHQVLSGDRPVIRVETASFVNAPESQHGERWRELMTQTTNSLDLARGELVRPVLVELGPSRHVLLLTIHHFAFDRGSVRSLLGELRDCYTALSNHQPLPETLPQFIDLAAYLEALPSTDRGRIARAFWDKTLAGAQPLALPADHPRAAVDAQRDAAPRGVRPSPVAGEVNAVVPASVHADVQRLVRTERVTGFMVLMASVLVTLQRTTGQEDLILRMTHSLRGLPEANKMIGFVANHLLIRVNAAGNPTFRELLQRTRSAVLTAWAHGEIPVASVAPHTLRRMNLNYIPAAQAIIETAPFAPGIEVTNLSGVPPATRAKLPYDFSLWMREAGDHLTLQFQYIADLYERPTMEAFIARYVETLTEVCRDANARIRT
jgi:hypothetical protein